MNPNELQSIFEELWSEETSPHWQAHNPPFGQGAVTALAVHDIFGGEIVKTEAPSGWHYYNMVDGLRFDLTKGQFLDPLGYSDELSTRDEALSVAGEDCYFTLKAKLKDVIG